MYLIISIYCFPDEGAIRDSCCSYNSFRLSSHNLLPSKPTRTGQRSQRVWCICSPWQWYVCLPPSQNPAIDCTFAVFGLVFGALITQYINWTWIFYVSAIVAAPLTIIVFLLVPSGIVTGDMDPTLRGWKKVKELDITGVSLMKGEWLHMICEASKRTDDVCKSLSGAYFVYIRSHTECY